MHARRHRFLSGLVIVVFALSANALLDYRLILRNPAELEEIARNALQGIFPDYTPHIGRAPEFFLSERKAVLHDVVFHEKGQAGRTLFRVGTLEAYFRLVPPGLVRLNVVEPEGVLRIDREGNVNFETGGEVGGGSRPTLLTDLQVQVDGGQLRLINEFEGQKTDVLLTDMHADFAVTTDLAVKGQGGALFGLVVPAGSTGREVPKRGLEADKRFTPLLHGLSFRVEREASGRVRAEADLGGGELSALLRSVIPPLFQREVWDELDPSGHFDARLRLETNERGARIATTVLPRPAAIRPRGFPTDITDIVGRFEVNVFVPWPGAGESPRPDFIGVSWDGLTARTNGGKVSSRGSVFPGEPGEKVSLFINVLAEELVLSPAFRNALPEKIRAVYDEFDPQGVVQRGRVVIFKGPHQEDPQLSVRVDELAGKLSASYREVPLRLQELTGTFEIREDANVEIHAGGTFQNGGTARVDANVIKGDLMHVEVRAADVPIDAPVLAALPERARAIAAMFRPQSGQADVHVVVDKAHAGALALPTVNVQLRDVTVVPEDVPYPLTTTGQLVIVPRFPAGARPEDHPDPERIDVDIDLTAWGAGVVAATAKGGLTVTPGGAPFEGELRVRASQVSLDDRLRDALPPALLDVWRHISPAGTVRLAEATILGPERIRVKGEAGDVTVRLEHFPMPLRVDAFEVERDGPLVRLVDVRGGSPSSGGSLIARGTVLAPPAEGRPIVDVQLQAQDMPIGEELVAALPAGPARDQLAGMRPSGRADAALRLLVPPAGGAVRVDGPVHLRGAQAFLHELDPGGSLAGLSEEPLRGLTGTITLALPERLELTALRGTLRQGQVEATGVIAQAPARPANGDGAPPPDGPAIDLVVHVGGLVLDERTRAMAGPRAAETFRRFQPEGPVDLQAHVHRPAGSPETSVKLRARARGLSAVPSFFPLRVHDVEGEVEVDDGEPVFVDLTARLGAGTITIRRERAAEAAFPGAGSRGRVFEVDLRDFSRPVDPRERKLLEQHLPENGEVRKLLGTLEPEGPLDVHAFIYQPFDERAAMRWLAEVRFGPRNDAGMPARPDFGFQLGSKKLRFDGIRGVVRVGGRVAELERGEVDGEVELTQLEYSKQTARNVRGRFRLQDGVLSFGLPGAPVVGELYGGKLKVLADFTLQTGQYGGRVAVEDARLQRTMEELNELARAKAEAEQGDERKTSNVAARPYRGVLDAEVEFGGGGKSLGGRERPLDGGGWVLIRDTNLAEVSQLDLFRVISDSFEGEHSRPFAFERLDIKFGLRPDRLRLDRISLEAPSGFQLVCLDGQMLFDPPGELVNVILTLADGRSSVAQRFLESTPGVGYKVTGKLWDPGVSVLPFYGPIERAVRWIFGVDDTPPAEPAEEPEAED